MTKHFFLFLLSSSFLAHSAELICGKTLDSASLPVPRAQVILYSQSSELQSSTHSDAAGRYCFADLPRGEYLLDAKAPKLHLAALQPILLANQTAALPDLVLSIAAASQEITVTANGFAQPASEVSKQMSVIDIDDAETAGQNFLASAANYLPGVTVAQQGGPGSFVSMHIHGLRSFDTSVLIDGIRLREVSATQADSTAFLSDLWLTGLTRVEVLEGAGASLYGTNAIGGVINLVSDHGGGPFHGDLELSGGMLGQALARVHFAGGIGSRFFYSANFGHINSQGAKGIGPYRNNGGSGHAEYLTARGLRIGASILGSVAFSQLEDSPLPLPPTSNPSSAISAIGLGSSQISDAVNNLNNGLPFVSGAATFVPAYDDPDASRTVRFIASSVYLEQQLQPNLHYRVSFQDLDSLRNYVNGPVGLGYQPSDRTSTKYDSRTDTVNATLEWQPIHSQLLSAGYEFERESYSSPAYTGQTPVFLSSTSAVQASNAVFAQDQIRLLGDKLQVSLSGRWQGFDLSAPQFSGVFPVYASASALSPHAAFTGDAAVAYFFRSSNTKIRSHVGNAYRAPSLYERFGTYFYGGTFSAYGDPRLSPERAISFDGGFDQYFANGKLKISASYFYTRLQETVGFDPGVLVTPTTDPYFRYGGYYNTPGGLARGLELSSEVKLAHGLMVRAGFAHTKSVDRISEYSDGQLQTPSILPEKFTLVMMRPFGRHWDTTFDAVIGSHYLFPLYNALPPYNVLAYSFEGPRKLGAAIGYTKPLSERAKLRIYTRLDNLTNQRHFEEGYLTPRFVAQGGMQISF